MKHSKNKALETHKLLHILLSPPTLIIAEVSTSIFLKKLLKLEDGTALWSDWQKPKTESRVLAFSHEVTAHFRIDLKIILIISWPGTRLYIIFFKPWWTLAVLDPQAVLLSQESRLKGKWGRAFCCRGTRLWNDLPKKKGLMRVGAISRANYLIFNKNRQHTHPCIIP